MRNSVSALALPTACNVLPIRLKSSNVCAAKTVEGVLLIAEIIVPAAPIQFPNLPQYMNILVG